MNKLHSKVCYIYLKFCGPLNSLFFKMYYQFPYIFNKVQPVHHIMDPEYIGNCLLRKNSSVPAYNGYYIMYLKPELSGNCVTRKWNNKAGPTRFIEL